MARDAVIELGKTLSNSEVAHRTTKFRRHRSDLEF